MPRKSKQQRWSELHAEFLAEFDRAQAASVDQRAESLSDRRFAVVAGAQWEEFVDDPDENRLHLEINRIHGAKIRLEGEHRNNRVTVDYLAKDDAPPESADAANGVFRADCEDCGADEAFDNAFSEGILGGMGGAELVECYVHDLDADADYDESDFEDGDEPMQRIRIEPIVDADTSLFFDPNSKKADKSDAMWGCKVVSMSPQKFEHDYPDAQPPASWPKEIWRTPLMWDWCTPDVVYVATWFQVTDDREDWVRLENPLLLDNDVVKLPASAIDPKEGEEEAQRRKDLLATGYKITRRYKKKVRKVTRYVMTGAEILEEQEVAGRYIPLVPYYAMRDYVENKERWQGIVRVAKDPQRLTNALTSWMAETAATAPAQVPILAAEQVAGHESLWDTHNTNPKSWLPLNLVRDADGNPVSPQPAVAYSQPSQIQPSVAGLLQFIGTDLRELVGAPSMEQRDRMASNVSGKALEIMQQPLDALTFIYLDNFKKFMRQVGVVFKSKMKALYVEQGRKMNTLSADGRKRSTITLGEAGVSSDGSIRRNGLVDFAAANFDVVASVGPSTASRREKAARAFMQMAAVAAPIDPQLAKTYLLMASKNLEGVEGAGEIVDFVALELLRMGVGKPTPDQQRQLAQEAQARAQQPPDPQAQANLAFAQKEKTLAAKAMADSLLSMAKTKQTEAQTVETLAKAKKLGVDTTLAVHDAVVQASSPAEPVPLGPGEQPA